MAFLSALWLVVSALKFKPGILKVLLGEIQVTKRNSLGAKVAKGICLAWSPEPRVWRELWLALSPWLTALGVDRKSTRLNSSHVRISYAVFCLKKKTQRK